MLDENDDLTSMQQYLNYAWNEQLLLLMGIAAFLGLGKGGVPGLATIATAVTVATSPQHIQGGLGLAVALQVPILTMIDVAAACLHAKDVDIQAIVVLMPLSFVGMWVGQWLTRQLTDASARLLVGILLLLILSIQLGNDAIVQRLEERTSALDDNEQPNARVVGIYDVESGSYGESILKTTTNLTKRRTPRSSNVSEGTDEEPLILSHDMKRLYGGVGLIRQTRWTWACVVGIVGGAATMLTNAMGPILNIYLLNVVRLSPSAYIATRAFFFCVVNGGKLPMRFVAGTLAWPMMPLAVLLGAISVLGVIGARPIMLSIAKDKFVMLELAVVAFSGLQLCWMGIFGD